MNFTVNLHVKRGTDADGNVFYGIVTVPEELDIPYGSGAASISFTIVDDTGETGTQPWTWIPAPPYGFLMYSNAVGSSGIYEFGSTLSSDYKTLTLTDANDMAGGFTYIATLIRQQEGGAWPTGKMDAAATDPIVVNMGPPS